MLFSTYNAYQQKHNGGQPHLIILKNDYTFELSIR